MLSWKRQNNFHQLTCLWQAKFPLVSTKVHLDSVPYSHTEQYISLACLKYDSLQVAVFKLNHCMQDSKLKYLKLFNLSLGEIYLVKSVLI